MTSNANVHPYLYEFSTTESQTVALNTQLWPEDALDTRHTVKPLIVVVDSLYGHILLICADKHPLLSNYQEIVTARAPAI